MKKEINFAVESFHRIAFGTKKHGNKYISESKLASFITILTDLLIHKCEPNWFPENPNRGSAHRCLRMNHQSIDPIVRDSLSRAEIYLPRELRTTELTIWVDPGCVSVRIGEDGSIGSEILDREVYNMSRRPRTPTPPVKRLGSVEEDDMSSRSCSPESTTSLRSDSASPPLFSATTPRFGVSSVSPVMDYNPYNRSSSVSYPHLYRQSPSPSSSVSSSPQSLKNLTPTRAFRAMAAATQARSPLGSSRGSPLPFTPQGDLSQAGQSHIPSVSHQRQATYTRPRAIFPSASEDKSHLEGLSKMSCDQYSMSYNYGRNMSAGNFYDIIPAMA